MEEWYYAQNSKQLGPVSWDELRRLAATGVLKPSDMIWKEGLLDWMKAEKQVGLFGRKGARIHSSTDVEEDRPRHAGARVADDDEGRPRRRDQDDYDDRPRRRRRRSEGMSVGAKVAIIGSSVAVGLVVIILVIILLVRSHGGGGGGGQGPGAFTVTLNAQQQHIRPVVFQGGQLTRVSVISTVTDPMTDVDLVIERMNGMQVAIDNAVGKDCNVTFVPPVTEPYRVRIINLGPGQATCVLTHN